MSLITTWVPVFKERATIYHWFSGLFAEELSEKQFSAYQKKESHAWLNTFKSIGLDDEIQRLKTAINQWQEKALTPIDLRADFAELFLLDTKVAAIPYASFYLEEGGLLYGKMESQMRYFLSQNQLQIQSDFKEPADHISVYLALLSTWTTNCLENKTIETTTNEQLDFLQQALITWLPQFVERCQSVHADSDFYAALAQLLLAFVEADIDYLQQLSDEIQVKQLKT